MRSVQGRNADAARRLNAWATANGVALTVLELDVTSDTSVRNALDIVLGTDSGLIQWSTMPGVSSAGPLEAFSNAQMATQRCRGVLERSPRC